MPATSASPLAGRKPDLSITTNGATFRLVAEELRDGRARPGEHQPRHVARATGSWQMTRRDELDRVLDGIEAAKEAGFAPVKINAVIERGVNDDEIVDLAEFGRDHDVEVRFIEFMPLDADGHWINDQVVSQDEIVAAIADVYPLEQMPSRGAAPADTLALPDGRGTVGVIPTVTKPFCGDCDRVRLTADGQLPHLPVRHRRARPAVADAHRGRRRQALAAAIERAVGTKWAGHRINR